MLVRGGTQSAVRLAIGPREVFPDDMLVVVAGRRLWLTRRPHRSPRLARMLPSLVEEFADRHSAVEIRGCADAILARYDDAPVRSYTTILATRQARDCLREDTCAALSTT